jgi:glutamate formiminotransferase/formiminotetrahydrofolate cyclodeaminase
MQLLECVPNFSEGRDKGIIDSIAHAMGTITGVNLLNIDTGETVNRTVITFIGPPAAVCTAAFAGIKRAAETIDMRRHRGVHPRLGSTDVCPLIPLANISDEEALNLADRLAQRVGTELRIPVYLYEKSAIKPHRKYLAQIRSGQYEGMAKKMHLPGWKPDYGPLDFNRQTGVTVIGVRDLLIAFNINLIGNVLPEALEIAKELRKNRASGRLRFCRALAWYLPEINRTQVTTNLTNYKVTALHTVFEQVKHLAQERGLQVTGSELVGMVPSEALIDAGRCYAGKEDRPPEELMALAVKQLNLNDLYPFHLTEKVLSTF